MSLPCTSFIKTHLKKVNMKICQVYDNESADKTSAVYSTVPVCDDCLAEYENEAETIINVSNFDPSYGDSCYYCNKSKKEEDEEKNLI